ncbi:hypothetical protein Tco_0126478 [Tanacetum coccineum]
MTGCESYLVYGVIFFVVSDMRVLGALCTISEYADCPELSNISTCANDPMITVYCGDPKSAGISTYANNPTYVDISAWTSLFWNCISISHLDTKDDVKVSLEWDVTCMMGMMLINKEVDVWYHWLSCGTGFWKCNRNFSFDDFDDGRCMLNFEVYAGSSSMIMMMGMSIT